MGKPKTIREILEKIIKILKLYQGGNELHIATEWSFIDLAQKIAKEIKEDL